MIKAIFLSLFFLGTVSFAYTEKGHWDSNLPVCHSKQYTIFFDHQILSSDYILSSMDQLGWNSLFVPTASPSFYSGLPFISMSMQLRNPDNLEWNELKTCVESMIDFLKNKEGVSIVCSFGREDMLAPYCGNARLDAGEQCDDGNFANGDGCRYDCTFEICGNGVTDPARTM